MLKTSNASFCKSKLLNTLVLTALGAPALALAEDAAPAAPYTITSNVGITSDYTFRGISQTFREPAIQGGFDFVHSNGLFLGTWASNISGNQYTNANMEWDWYGGYTGKVNDDLSYTVGVIDVIYPGGKTSIAPPNKKWDTTEVNIGATWKGLNVKYSQTLTDWYGIDTAGFSPVLWKATDTAATGATGATTANSATANSRGSGYLEANYSYELPGKVVVSAHAGHQKIKNFDLLSYTDYKLGVTKDVGGYVLGAAYTKTNATDNSLYDVTNGVDKKNLRGGIFAVSVNRTF
jgi:uncharacterized protein (TIGR02001 family)